MHLSYSDIARYHRVTPAEAVTLALAAARALDQRETGTTAPALPPPEHILLNGRGVSLQSTGGSAQDEDRARRLASLVRELVRLEDDERGGGSEGPRVPGPLLVLLARSAGELDAPPLSYADLRQALGRFGAADGRTLAAVHSRALELALGDTAAQAVAVEADWDRVAAIERQFTANHPEIRHFEAEPVAPHGGSRRAAVSLAALLAGVAIGWLSALALVDNPAAVSGPALEVATITIADDAGTPASERRSATTVDEPSPAAQTRESPPAPVGAGGANVRGGPSAAVRVSSASPLLLSESVGADAFSPAFAPHGRDFVFHAGRERGTLMRASIGQHGDVRVATLLHDGAANYHAALSPDGTRLAYDSDRDGIRGVYVATHDGSASRRVSGEGYAALPGWSPDGRALAFVRAEPKRPNVWNVWLLNLESGALSRVSGHRVGQAWRPSWFPDGHRLAYSVEDSLVIVDLRRGSSRVFRSPRRGRLVRTPAVSPDGRWIVFQLHRDGVWLLDVSTGAMRRVLPDPTAEEFAWSPDGQRIVYHARRGRSWSVWQLAVAQT